MPRSSSSVIGGATTAIPSLRRSNNNKTKKSSSSSSNNNKPNKIVIRPYEKPPELPPNYYQTTVDALLRGLTAVLQQRLLNNNNGSSSSSTTTATTTTTDLSFQSAYQSVSQLVSHQYGARLYKDLVVHNLQHAAQLVVVDKTSNNSKNTIILEYICTQYSVYTDYLLLLQHICLPLDSTWQYQLETDTAVPITTTTTTSHTPPLRNLWQVGLQIFNRRLAALQLHSVLYDAWLHELLRDWNSNNNNNNTSSTDASTTNTSMMMVSSTAMTISETRRYLQQVWYLWQDLGLLSSLTLQRDLERYWSQISETWKTSSTNTIDDSSSLSSSSYNVTGFLDFCYHKHVHCTVWRPWLPVPWLWNILDTKLVQPHLQDNQYLLNDEYLFPVLSQQVFAAVNKSGSSTTTTATTTVPQQQQDPGPIQQLWNLAGRLHQRGAVAAAIQRFAKAQGLQRVVRGKNAVTELLELQDCLNAVIKQLLLSGSGRGNETPSSSLSSIINLKSVWEEVVNYDTTPSLAEQLAKFLDSILRSTKKMDAYHNDDDWLQRIISGLFVPIAAKDIFEGFYKRDLAKRLLWNRVVSMDVEKQVCSLLKAECGAGYTSKMEGMFQDVEWSRETMLVYKQSTASSSSAPANSSTTVDMEVQVLTTGYWPVYPQYPNLTLPDALKIPQDQFANHYKTKYQGRRMTWQYALGHCVVRCHGWSKPYELLVSLCQALVLIQFETGETVRTLPQLMVLTGLEDRGEMERILQSLALGKDGTRILRKMDYDAEPGKKKKTRMNVDDRDTFVVNSAFESNSRRIRITNVMMKETKEERQKTVETVSRDRLYLIDAVLVRIMKARKTILHQALIPQVLEQVKVPAQTADVKKRIESLIEREYMERDAKDRNRYNYLA